MVKSFAFNKQNDRKIEDTIKEENERERKKTKKIRMEERERDGLHKKSSLFLCSMKLDCNQGRARGGCSHTHIKKINGM